MRNLIHAVKIHQSFQVRHFPINFATREKSDATTSKFRPWAMDFRQRKRNRTFRCGKWRIGSGGRQLRTRFRRYAELRPRDGRSCTSQDDLPRTRKNVEGIGPVFNRAQSRVLRREREDGSYED